MSRTYDNEILASVRAILLADDTSPNPDNGEYCIEYFVQDNIFQEGSQNIMENHPRITLDFILDDSELSLPHDEGVLVTRVWYTRNTPNFKTLSRRCGGRIIDLLNRNPSSINSQGFGAQVRTIKKVHAELILPQNITDDLSEYNVVFDISFGDSWTD